MVTMMIEDSRRFMSSTNATEPSKIRSSRRDHFSGFPPTVDDTRQLKIRAGALALPSGR